MMKISDNDQALAVAQLLAARGTEISAANYLVLLARATGTEGEPIVAPVPAWLPAHGPMTDPQYVSRNGATCPICGSTELSGANIEIDGGTAAQEINCAACNAQWTDHYALKGYQLSDDSEIPFLSAILSWLQGAEGSLTKTQAEQLDNLVLQAKLEEAMADVNSSSEASLQEEATATAESEAATVNNEGPLVQLAYLFSGFDIQAEFVEFLAKNFALSSANFSS